MMAQLQSTIEPRSTRIPNEQSQDLLQLSPEARKYVRTLCDSDFTKRLKDTSSNNEKRVSFSDDTKTHKYPVLTGTRLGNLPYGRVPSAGTSPASSILKKEDECETHEPPTRRYSFPFATPKIRALQRLSELVNAKRKRRGSSVSSSSSSLESVIEEDDNENAILDFPEPSSSSTTPPTRRQSSPEIDFINPFQHPRDRQRRSSRSSSTSRFSITKESLDSIRRGSLDLVKVASSKVRSLSRGSFSDEQEEEGSFEGPLWTDQFDLNLPASVRPDMTEIEFMRRTQEEERDRVRFEKEKARAAESLKRLAAMRARLEEQERVREQEENMEIQSQSRIPLEEELDDADDFHDNMYELEERQKRVEQAVVLSTIPEHEEAVDNDMAFDGWQHRVGVGNNGSIEWTIPVY